MCLQLNSRLFCQICPSSSLSFPSKWGYHSPGAQSRKLRIILEAPPDSLSPFNQIFNSHTFFLKLSFEPVSPLHPHRSYSHPNPWTASKASSLTDLPAFSLVLLQSTFLQPLCMSQMWDWPSHFSNVLQELSDCFRTKPQTSPWLAGPCLPLPPTAVTLPLRPLAFSTTGPVISNLRPSHLLLSACYAYTLL